MAGSQAPTTPWRQVRLLAVVFAVLTGLLAASYFLFLRREYVVLFSDLRSADAAALVAELDADHVDYQLRDGGSRILVPAQQADAIRLSVAGSEMAARGVEGFELFDSSDLGLTDFAQRIKFQRAMQGELARTIMMMEGVTEARVHISMSEASAFRTARQPAKAAVTLITQNPSGQSASTVEGVQRLVAAAIPDLDTSDVVVLNGRGEVISAAPSPAGTLPEPASTALPGQADQPPVTTAADEPVRPPSPPVRVHRTDGEAGFAPPTPHPTVQPAPPLGIGVREAIVTCAGLAALAAIAWILLRSRRRRPLLSLESHQRFADRLRLALDMHRKEPSHEG